MNSETIKVIFGFWCIMIAVLTPVIAVAIGDIKQAIKAMAVIYIVLGWLLFGLYLMI